MEVRWRGRAARQAASQDEADARPLQAGAYVALAGIRSSDCRLFADLASCRLSQRDDSVRAREIGCKGIISWRKRSLDRLASRSRSRKGRGDGDNESKRVDKQNSKVEQLDAGKGYVGKQQKKKEK